MPFHNQKEVQKRRLELESELAKLDEVEKQLPKDPVIQLADTLHSKMCHWNHTDQCSYGYGNNVDKEYMEKAKKLLGIVTPKTAFEIIEAIWG